MELSLQSGETPLLLSKKELKMAARCDILMSTMTEQRTPANAKKLAQLQAVWTEILDGALCRGFFGTATVELSIQDGTIQHIRRRTEQIEK